MKTKALRFKDCKHCKEEFMYSRTDKIFCCVSCRSAAFSMRKRAGTVKPLRGIVLQYYSDTNVSKEQPSDYSFGKNLGATALVIAANELQKSIRGVNDKSQMELLKTIRDDQKRLITLVLAQGEVLKKLSTPPEPTNYHIGSLLGN